MIIPVAVSYWLYLILWSTIPAFLVHKWYQWWKSPHPRFPPGYRGFPFIGVLPFKKPSYEVIADWTRDLGNVVSSKLMHLNVVSLCKYEDIHDAFTKNGSLISDRPEIAVLNDVNKGYGLVEKNYNAICKAHRKFGNSLFKGYLCSSLNIETICKAEAAKFVSQMMKCQTDKPFDPRVEFFKITGNVISRIVFGKRFDYDDSDFKMIIQCSTESFGDIRNAKLLFAGIFLPCIRFLPPFRNVYKRYLSLNQQILDYIECRIDEHKKKLDESEPYDFIDAYLKQGQSSKDYKNLFTDAELRGYVKDLFLAGTDTSSNTLAWAFAILLHHKDYQNKIHKEIDNIVGLNEEVNLSHRDSLPITCAFIQEVMRYRTLVPNGVPHQTSKDIEFKQYHLPKKTMVIANLWAVHNDPENWENPHIFNPERHLDENGNFVSLPRIIPFSLGLRRCIGERIARTEIFIFFTSILQHFDVFPDPNADKLPEIEKALPIIVYSPYQYNMVLQKRHHKI